MFKLYSEITVGGSKIELRNFDNDCFSFKLEETSDSIKGVFTAKKDMTMSKLILKGDRDFDDKDFWCYPSKRTRHLLLEQYPILQIQTLELPPFRLQQIEPPPNNL